MGIHEQKGQAAYSVESKANARHKLQYGWWWFFFLAIFAFSGILKEEGFFAPLIITQNTTSIF